MGDCAQNINIVRDPICDDFNNIQVDTLPWERVSDTPTTLVGYGITDACSASSVYNKNEVDSKINTLTDSVKSVSSRISTMSSKLTSDYYTKKEVDSLIKNIDVDNVYTKTEIDSMLEDFVSDDVYTKSEIDKKFANIDINIDTYTKAEIDAKLSNITASGVDINEEELNTMLNEVLGE
jgi:hypothetical protein